MSEDTVLIDIALGTIQAGPFQFIRQLVVPQADSNFEIVLPGQITRCNDTTALLGILPYGQIVIEGDPLPRHALVSGEVTDQASLTDAVYALGKNMEFQKLRGFAIRFASTQHSYADVVGRAEAAEGDCGCEDSPSGAALVGTLSVGLSEKSGRKLEWSDPVHAILRARIGEGYYGPFKPGVGFRANFIDCDSEWWIEGFYSKFSTTCHGTCNPATKICACRKDSKGRLHTACDDWVLCWCQ